MINKLMQIVAPHYCYGCDKIGSVLCHNCKYDIVDDAIDACIVCLGPAMSGICENCRTSYSRAWMVGERTDVLHDLIDAFKFERVVDAADALASLLDARLPVLPESTIVVPVPTMSSHIRQRGYDHALLLAKKFARTRSAPVNQLITRNGSSVQRGKSKAQRLKQAATTYQISSKVNPDATYLLIDDVVTTNATLRYCAAALKDAGAKEVWVAVVARQPLDK